MLMDLAALGQHKMVHELVGQHRAQLNTQVRLLRQLDSSVPRRTMMCGAACSCTGLPGPLPHPAWRRPPCYPSLPHLKSLALQEPCLPADALHGHHHA